MIRFLKKIFWGVQPAWLQDASGKRKMIWIPCTFQPPVLFNQSFIVCHFDYQGKKIDVLWSELIDVKNGMYIFRISEHK